jgi:hypothetical protein
MKTTQYVRQENAITASDSNGIRERLMWGLRILRDSEAMAASGRSLRHGVAEQLIAAAGVNSKGRNRLSEQEIQRRLRAARAYPTETQIRNAVTDFDTWHDLVAAGFPPYDAPEGEPPADYRTPAEQRHDRARALADTVGEQGSFFPLSVFEPVTTTLKELADYADEQEAITERFAAHDKKRRDYLDGLIKAADGDLSTTWQAAIERGGES